MEGLFLGVASFIGVDVLTTCGDPNGGATLRLYVRPLSYDGENWLVQQVNVVEARQSQLCPARLAVGTYLLVTVLISEFVLLEAGDVTVPSLGTAGQPNDIQVISNLSLLVGSVNLT